MTSHGTKKDALDEVTKILQELEYRSHRAAYMNYTLSNKYETYEWWCHIGITLAGGVSSSYLWNVFIKTPDMFPKRWLHTTGLVFAGLAGCAISFFHICPQYLLPTLEKKCKLHNDAGAGWQEIEILIRGFKAVNVKEGLPLEQTALFINTLAEKRRDVCMIARPTQWMHKFCEGNPELFANRKRDLEKAVDEYFRVQTDTTEE